MAVFTLFSLTDNCQNKTWAGIIFFDGRQNLKLPFINCIKAAESLKVNIDTSHAAWSENCSVFLKKMKIEKRHIKSLTTTAINHRYN